MKKICLLFITISFLFMSGCTTSVKTNPKEEKTINIQIEKEVPKPEAEKPRTTITRILPKTYSSGEPLLVTLKVKPIPGTTGVIIEETLPPNWKITSATPAWMKYEEGAYKWLIFERNLKEFEVKYEVTIPNKEKGVKEFKGIGVTFKEKNFPIEGDNSINHN